MCLSCNMRVKKPTQWGAPLRNFIPCGHCKDCDEVYRASWSFRLRVELEKLALQGWQVGFLTLTYKDLCLPHFPPCVFNNVMDYKSVQCFNREDTESFIRSLRSYLWREYHLEGEMRLRYFLCSEFGSNTQRAHYHLVLAFPPQVDSRKVFKKCHRLWESKGHVFPRYFEGGVDSHGYHHKPFICSSASATAKYVAKYATKDMYYAEYLEKHGLDLSYFRRKHPVYRNCAQFHLGSRSLGVSMLDGLDEKERLKLLERGYCFAGDVKYYTLPVYFKHKIIFDNRYQYTYETPKCGQEGEDDIVFYRVKRLVRREANAFFLKYYNEIFRLKVARYVRLFDQMTTYDEYYKRGVKNEFASVAVRAINDFKAKWRVGKDTFAALYLAYYGVVYERIYHAPLALEWLHHYCDVTLYENQIFSYREMFKYKITKEMFNDLQTACSTAFKIFFMIPKEYTQEDKDVARVSDFFGHLI